MKTRSESYPERIRKIADELSRVRKLHGVDQTVEKLRSVASELERNLKNLSPKG